MTRRERIVIGLVATVAWAGLLLQADLSVNGMLAKGLTLSDAVIRFFSFFTILTNSLIAVDSSVCVFAGAGRWNKSLLHSSLATCLAVSILFVSAAYTLLLRQYLHLAGLPLLANTILHYIVPSLFLLYWGFFASRHPLPWSHAVWWTLYPFLYFLYALVQGWRTGLYPYPFIDARRIGYHHALLNGGVLLILFWLGGLLFIGLGRQLHHCRKE